MSDPSLPERKHLLVVEDNPDDVELLQLALAEVKAECDLTVFSDGEEAIKWVQSVASGEQALTQDLAILDLNVPKCDGLEVLDAILNTPECSNLPIVILTSSCSPRETARLKLLPIVRHLTKPMGIAELLTFGATLKELLDGLLPVRKPSI